LSTSRGKIPGTMSHKVDRQIVDSIGFSIREAIGEFDY
jgi:hypothetical protein